MSRGIVPVASSPAVEADALAGFFRRHGVSLAAITAVAVLVAHASLMLNFWSDDAFITYRYARNLATGAGAVFNPGERVEGYSNPLLMLLLAALYRVAPGPEALPWIARGIGFLAGVVTLIAMVPLQRALPGWAVALAILLTAMNTSFALWSIGGLETTIYGALITVGFVRTVFSPRTAGARVLLGLMLAAIVLSRPEGVLPAGALFVWRLLDPETRRDVRGHLLVAFVAAAPTMGYLVFRYAYFGDWVTNTYFVKQVSPGDAIVKAFRYLASFFQCNGGLALYAPLLFAFAGASGERRGSRLAALVLAVYSVFLWVVGRDWMSNHRFVAPLVPLLFLLVGLGWVNLLRVVRDGLESRGSRAAGWAIPAGCAFACALLALASIEVTRDQRQRPNMSVLPYFDVIGRVVGHAAPPSWTLATHDIGAVGWYGGTRMLDMLGLADREIARGTITGDQAIAERRPELVLLHYDNRYPPRERWLRVEMVGFDALYTLPRGLEGLPRSLRVRRDVALEFERGLARVPESLRQQVRDLRDHLVHHQPDMYPVLVSDPP